MYLVYHNHALIASGSYARLTNKVQNDLEIPIKILKFYCAYNKGKEK